MDELDPLSAVSAMDPYRYYERLVLERPFYRDTALGMWVASSASAVEAILSHATMRVRPPAEPVPQSIVGTSLGDLFSCLVRVTDGSAQRAMKTAIYASLTSLAPREVAVASERAADFLMQSLSFNDDASLNAYLFGLPVLVVASLIGISSSEGEWVATSVSHLVRSFAPGSSHDEIARGAAAADALMDAITGLFAGPCAARSLVGALSNKGRRGGIAENVITANAIGLLIQSYEATAALIANTLLALARAPANLRAAAAREAGVLERVVAEVVRHDAPVQNTRRFAAADATVLGSAVAQGDGVLVVLAAANRDASVNPEPHRFDIERTARRTYTFGVGGHACPAAAIATTVASAGVSRLLKRGLDPATLTTSGYRPSPNVRTPDLRRRRAPG